MINKVTDSLAQAFSGIQDGSVVMIGGFGGSGSCIGPHYREGNLSIYLGIAVLLLSSLYFYAIKN